MRGKERERRRLRMEGGETPNSRNQLRRERGGRVEENKKRGKEEANKKKMS